MSQVSKIGEARLGSTHLTCSEELHDATFVRHGDTFDLFLLQSVRWRLWRVRLN